MYKTTSGIFKRVLVAIDFGEPSTRAVDVAVALASTFEAELLVMHAYWFPPVAYSGFTDGIAWQATDLMEQDAKTFDAALAGVRARHPRTEGVLLTGEPSAMILQAAKEGGAHGRRGLSRVFLGSVAEKVVRLSPVPVLTIPGHADAAAKSRAQSDVAAPLEPRRAQSPKG